MEDIKYKEIRRGRGRRSPVDRRKDCAGYAGPERRSGKERRLAKGLATCMVAGSLLMGAADVAAEEVHGRRLTDRLHIQGTAFSRRQYSLLDVPTSIRKITPARIKAVETVDGESKALKTNYSTIYYDDADQLYGFSEAIEGMRHTIEGGEPGSAKVVKKEGRLARGIKSIFNSFARIFRGKNKAEEKEAPTVIKKLQSMKLTQERVDGLVRRVSTILYLDPPNLHMSIYLYDTHKGVKEAYRELGHTGEAPKAFYSLKSKAVYLPVDGLTGAIFAHEIAHAIINTFYNPPLPHKLQEVLAHHVYNNLKDE